MSVLDTLITDRTQADVTRWKTLHDKAGSRMSSRRKSGVVFRPEGHLQRHRPESSNGGDGGIGPAVPSVRLQHGLSEDRDTAWWESGCHLLRVH